MNHLKKIKIILSALAVLIMMKGFSQSVPQGINYQAIAEDMTGTPIAGTYINIKIGIYSGSATGTLEWEETHSVLTNLFGLFTLTIGQGTRTGGTLSVFDSIDWSAASKYMKVYMDNGSGYVVMDNSQLLSVPYALYSLKSGSPLGPVSMNDLTDADTTGTQIGKTLKWNGINWVPANDNNSDTALYATNCVGSTIDWHTNGNAAATTDFIGTTNASDFVIKTNNTEQMRITSAGKVGIGTSTPTASVHIIGNDGFISQGTFGSGTVFNPGAGDYMYWYPRKAAFRAGHAVSPAWNDIYVGNYSFATGYSSRATGVGSVSMGQNCVAQDTGGVAMGYNATSTGVFAIAFGNQPTASAPYSIAIGRANLASGFGAAAVGYHTIASGMYSTALGYYSTAWGTNSIVLGTETSDSVHSGCFVWADNTDYYTAGLPLVHNTTDNQFMAKASGGFIFYSNPTQTAGVSLPSGAGSWLTISDKNKKEHFKPVDGEAILNKISKLDIPSWNYKAQSPNIRHIGPMAQDLYAAFHFGESDTTITSSDIDGINMIAVQALAERTKQLKQKANEIEDLKAQITALKSEKAKLEKRMTIIEKQLNITDTSASAARK
jgi:hypothetical protein